MYERDDDDDIECPGHPPESVGLEIAKAVAIAGLSALACKLGELVVDEIALRLFPERKAKKDDE